MAEGKRKKLTGLGKLPCHLAILPLGAWEFVIPFTRKRKVGGFLFDAWCEKVKRSSVK